MFVNRNIGIDPQLRNRLVVILPVLAFEHHSVEPAGTLLDDNADLSVGY